MTTRDDWVLGMTRSQAVAIAWEALMRLLEGSASVAVLGGAERVRRAADILRSEWRP